MLFTDISSKVKVNGHVGDAFEIANSVKQGCPLAPYLYIISLQPLLDTLHANTAFRGVVIPGPLGEGEEEVRAVAYADDLAVYMAGFADLPIFGAEMRDYNQASGARSNWDKCDGLRLGALRGTLPDLNALAAADIGPMHRVRWRDLDNDHIHVGCDCQVEPNSHSPNLLGKKGVVLRAAAQAAHWVVEVAGDHYTLPDAALSVLPTRYLGVFLGGTLSVQRHWEQHIAPRVTSKVQQLLSRLACPRRAMAAPLPSRPTPSPLSSSMSPTKPPLTSTPSLEAGHVRSGTCTGPRVPGSTTRQGATPPPVCATLPKSRTIPMVAHARWTPLNSPRHCMPPGSGG